MTRAYLRRKLIGMAPVSLRRLALAGMVALGAACAETPEPETPDASIRGQYAKWRDQVLEWIDHNQALRTRANAGDTDAQYNLGFMYANGEGVPQDDAEARVWYRRAGKQGHAEAQRNLGEMWANGRGVPEDFGEAAAWYRRAAEQGDADSQFNLGVMYDTGEGVPHDFGEAAKWYRKAAEQGHAVAQYNLAFAYAYGGGVPQDAVEAYKWLNLATTYVDAEQREEFAEARDSAAEPLTPEQLAEGQNLSREWFEAHPRE